MRDIIYGHGKNNVCTIEKIEMDPENPLWLIGAYAPTGLKLFLKMSTNSKKKS
jgi:hypothetical protein